MSSGPLVSNGNDVWSMSPFKNRPTPVEIPAYNHLVRQMLTPEPEVSWSLHNTPPTEMLPDGTTEQFAVKAALQEQDIYMTVEEEQTLRAQCAIHGHEWRVSISHIPSFDDPLGQRGYMRKGTKCYYCGVPL